MLVHFRSAGRVRWPERLTGPERLPGPDRLAGIVAVPGLAIGPAFGLRTTAIEVREEGQSPALERQALGAARFKIRKALEAVARRGGDGAGIAVAHLAFLDDPEVSAAAERTIEIGRAHV